MAFTSPKTYVATNVLTASEMNTYQRDNMSATAPGVASSGAGLIVTTAANTVIQRTPAGAQVLTSEDTTSTSYTDLTTSGPAVTVTTGTAAIVFIHCQMQNTDVYYTADMSFAVSGATTRAAQTTEALVRQADQTGYHIQMGTAILVTGLTAGSNTFTCKYRVSGNMGTFVNRLISVVPL